MHRRDFLRTTAGAAGGAAAVNAAAGPAVAAEEGGGGEGGDGGGDPDFGGWFTDVSNFDGVEDLRGEESVTVQVGVEANGGPYGFSPAAVHVDAGTTVSFEWTGEGGEHNVVHQDGDFESDLVAEPGVNFERSFEDDGLYNYYCTPHRGLGMKGSVVVGSDYPTAGGGGGQEPLNPEHMGVPFQAHFVGFATILAILSTLVFTFYLLKYGESTHAKGGNN